MCPIGLNRTYEMLKQLFILGAVGNYARDLCAARRRGEGPEINLATSHVPRRVPGDTTSTLTSCASHCARAGRCGLCQARAEPATTSSRRAPLRYSRTAFTSSLGPHIFYINL